MKRYLGAISLVSVILLALSALLLHARSTAYRVQASSLAPPLRPEAALGTGFTYQGQLKKNGSAVNATCNFTFSLWDTVGPGGNQIGGFQAVNGVAIMDGLFTVTLNASGEFGPNAFNGEARWLQIDVTCPGDGGPITLDPRQLVTAAPYALTAPGSPYRNVVVVAQSGGDFTSIQVALNSIVNASASNPYLVWIAPGIYTERVTMKPYVDIEGAGQNVTKITFAGSGVGTTATLITASNTELRDLTVENTGGAAYAIAIFNDGTAPRLTDITALASGDGNISAAVFSDNSASPIITNATLNAFGGGFNHYALYSRDSSTHTVYESTINAYSGSSNNYGVISTVSSTANIYNSLIWGTTAAVHMLDSTGRIATSKLVGGVTTGGTGSLVCVGAYNQGFVALNISCQ